MPHQSAQAAATMAATFVALFAAHHLADYPLQPSLMANKKGVPTHKQLDEGAHAFAGWPAALLHGAVHAAVQGAALVLVWLVAPVSGWGLAAALLISVGTHVVIDRRTAVRWLMRWHPDWEEGPVRIDQSLHHACTLGAAMCAALVTSWPGLVSATAGLAVLIANCLIGEYARAAWGLTVATTGPEVWAVAGTKPRLPDVMSPARFGWRPLLLRQARVRFWMRSSGPTGSAAQEGPWQQVSNDEGVLGCAAGPPSPNECRLRLRVPSGNALAVTGDPQPSTAE